MLLTILAVAAGVGIYLCGYVLGRMTPSMYEWERRRRALRKHGMGVRP